jgi:Leucine-rich repeat (LRR) protein
MSSTPLLPGGIGFYKAGFTHSAHHITGLSLHGKELDTLPDSIQVLTRLERLYACNNQLTTLPSTIGALTNHLFLRIKICTSSKWACRILDPAPYRRLDAAPKGSTLESYFQLSWGVPYLKFIEIKSKNSCFANDDRCT